MTSEELKAKCSRVCPALETLFLHGFVATPLLSVPAGEVTSGTSLSISCETEGASIYYSDNGGFPVKKYTGAISLTASKTITAIAVMEGKINSGIVSAAYTVPAQG
jgi:hypothetical protein